MNTVQTSTMSISQFSSITVLRYKKDSVPTHLTSRDCNSLLPVFSRTKSSLLVTSRASCRSDSPIKRTLMLPFTNPALKTTLPTIFKHGTGILPPLQRVISSNAYVPNGGRTIRDWIELVGEYLSILLPVWVTLGCLIGLLRPSAFDWVTPTWNILGLTVTMLGMGMTLTLDDLRGAFAMPKEVLSGFVLQYSIMPLSGFLVSKLLNLPSHYSAGLILVACCPGGTASNIVTYIARGNVALSVLMTAASTLTAMVMTPFLTAKLAGQYIAVDAAGLAISTMQIVVLPVLAGAFVNQYLQGLVRLVSPLMPPIAVASTTILCGNAIAQCASAILMSGTNVILASFLLHSFGFFFGYLFARMLGLDVSSSRTISIEVGMQNSTLGLVLATQHFGNPLTAVPCAVSSVWHSIIGSALAGIWRRSVPAQKKD